MKSLLLLALCSSCTFTHVALNHEPPAPSVPLSAAMQKLDHSQHQSPWWTAAGDITLALTGFTAGPLAADHLPTSEVQTINLSGFALTGLVLMSLGVTLAMWGHL